jgi:hypothetical protein
VLVRKDLPHPQQVVQACHASLDAALAFPSAFSEHPNVIVCGIRDEPRLIRCLDRLERSGVRCRSFREPDLGGQLTAVATEPVRADGRRLFRQFQLLRGNG